MTLVFPAGFVDLDVDTSGSLTAIGTTTSPIVFTCANKTRGAWIGVRFEDSNSSNNNLQYVTVEYGGYSSGFAADIGITGVSTVTILNSIIQHTAGWGVYTEASSSLTHSGNVFSDYVSGKYGP